MKINMIKKLLLTSLVVFIIALIANKTVAQDLQQDNKELLTGKWKIDTIYLNLELKEEQMKLYKNAFKKIKAETRFIFNPDGTYKKISSDESKTGKWGVSKDGYLITIKFDDSEEISRTRIRSLTRNKLDMEPVKNADNNRVVLDKIK